MREYKSTISFTKNSRGIWSLDPLLGCKSGMEISDKGCYNDCYAARYSKKYGYDFSKVVLRYFDGIEHLSKIVNQIQGIDMPFIRMGTSGEPSENWKHVLAIIRAVKNCKKEIVIITKHFNQLTDEQLSEIKNYNVCINTSVSALDEEKQLNECLKQYERIKPYCKSILRIVSCDFNKNNLIGNKLSIIQDSLFSGKHVIDTVLRVSPNNPYVLSGVINIKKTKFMGKKCYVSKFNNNAYFGKCSSCTEMCGSFMDANGLINKKKDKQMKLRLKSIV